jgi:hypothetical protein
MMNNNAKNPSLDQLMLSNELYNNTNFPSNMDNASEYEFKLAKGESHPSSVK